MTISRTKHASISEVAAIELAFVAGNYVGNDFSLFLCEDLEKSRLSAN